jgi:hypothetical protein
LPCIVAGGNGRVKGRSVGDGPRDAQGTAPTVTDLVGIGTVTPIR